VWPACAEAADSWRFRVSGDVTYDDNVNRGISNSRLQDGFASLNVSATWPLELSHFTRLLLTGAVGGDHFIQYTGLDRAFAEFNGELQYRGSGHYTSPTYAMFVRESVDWYDSDLRDGSRTSVGVSVRKPLTDRIFLFGALAYNHRRAESPIFDTKDVSVRGTFDYMIAHVPDSRQSLESEVDRYIADPGQEVRYLPAAGSPAGCCGASFTAPTATSRIFFRPCMRCPGLRGFPSAARSR
jgi:hypothetical protein